MATSPLTPRINAIEKVPVGIYTGANNALASTPTNLTGYTVIHETESMINTSTGVVTIPEDGYYKILAWTPTESTSGTGAASVVANQSGSASVTRVIGRSTKTSSTANRKIMQGETILKCVTGDLVWLSASDADLNNVDAECRFELHKISDL